MSEAVEREAMEYDVVIVDSPPLGAGFERQMEDEVQGLIRAASTADAREGISAFIERRPAQFKGN